MTPLTPELIDCLIDISNGNMDSLFYCRNHKLVNVSINQILAENRRNSAKNEENEMDDFVEHKRVEKPVEIENMNESSGETIDEYSFCELNDTNNHLDSINKSNKTYKKHKK